MKEALATATVVALQLDRDGQIHYVNPHFEAVTGWRADAVRGRNWTDLTVGRPAGPEAARDLHDLFAGGGLMRTFEQRLRTSNGAEQTVQFNMVVLNNASGESQKLMLVGEDITEKLRTARELAESNRQLGAFLDTARDMIVFFAPNEQLRLMNPAGRETLGYDGAEAGGLRLSDLIHPDARGEVERQLEALRKSGRPVRFETTLITKHRRQVRVIISLTRQSNGENQAKTTEFRAVMHDITERVRSERSQRLYHTIAALTTQSTNLRELYRNIHAELEQAVHAPNLYIVLQAAGGGRRFAYFADEHPDTAARREMIDAAAAAVLEKQRSMIFGEEPLRTPVPPAGGEAPQPAPRILVCVPLRVKDRLTGVIAIASYRNRADYDRKDLKLLDFVSGQIALAIQHKQDEERLQDQTARLRAIFESSSHLIWSVNQQGRLTSNNQNYARTLQDAPDRTRDPFFRAHVDHYRPVFGGEARTYELRWHTDGRPVWWEIFLNPIVLADGRISEVSGIAHDITGRKQNALALKESEEKFRDIFESFQDVYFRTDRKGVITMISPSVKELCGYEPDEVLGKKITAYYIYNVKRRRAVRALWRRGSIRNFEIPIIRQDGTVIQFICNLRLIRDARGEVLSLEGVARDITELKQVNEEVVQAKDLAVRSLKVKEQFLANMSHEIRTPMNGVIGVVDLLADTRLDEEQRDYVQTIKRSSETLLTILNDILDISKIEAGKMQLRRDPFSLPDVVDKLVALFRQRADEKDIGLTYEIADGVPRAVLGDETRLLQVMSNLTSNAIKFTEQGHVSIHLTRHPLQGDRHRVRVEVRDTGIGISTEDQGRLFETFSQVDASVTKAHGGTGLGLVISKQLSRLMKGDIGVDSTPGRGSTFWFTFVVTAIDEAQLPARRPAVPEAFRYRFLEPPRVLLVDDNPVNRKVACEILRKAGCDVVIAADGRAAIDQIESHPFDIVFMDIQMPGMDGVTAMQRVRARAAGRALPPIVAMTAFSMQGDKARFVAAGMDDYLAKPIKPELLIEKVRTWTKHAVEERDSPDAPAGIDGEATGEPPAGEVVIDRKKVAGMMRYLDQEGTREAYDEFAQEAEEMLHEMAAAAATEDWEVVRSHLHTLKGNAGTFGVVRLAALAAALEGKLKQGDYVPLKAGVQNLFARFREYQRHYPTLLPPST
ncbi:MAG: PAS domain S-box protein, partial [Catalinimonas sp.]